VQVDHIIPNSKPPATKRLKLKCDVLLSTSAFKFNMRRYTMAVSDEAAAAEAAEEAAAAEAEVGRCRLTLSKPS